MRISTRVDEGVAFISVSGDLDLATADEFRNAGQNALTDFVGTLRIDLGGVSFLDSTGLGALIAIRNRAQPHHTVILDNPTRQVLRVLEITGMRDFFRIETLGWPGDNWPATALDEASLLRERGA